MSLPYPIYIVHVVLGVCRHVRESMYMAVDLGTSDAHVRKHGKLGSL